MGDLYQAIAQRNFRYQVVASALDMSLQEIALCNTEQVKNFLYERIWNCDFNASELPLELFEIEKIDVRNWMINILNSYFRECRPEYISDSDIRRFNSGYIGTIHLQVGSSKQKH